MNRAHTMLTLVFLSMMVPAGCTQKVPDVETNKVTTREEPLANETKTWIVVRRTLILRERPDLQSRILEVVKSCQRVTLQEKTNVWLKPDDEEFAPFFKVLGPEGAVGYVHSAYLAEDPEAIYPYNETPTSIIGRWAMYDDAPNSETIFGPDGRFRLESYGFHDGPGTSEEGTFIFDGSSVVRLKSDGGAEYNGRILLNKSHGEQRMLTLGCGGLFYAVDEAD